MRCSSISVSLTPHQTNFIVQCMMVHHKDSRLARVQGINECGVLSHNWTSIWVPSPLQGLKNIEEEGVKRLKEQEVHRDAARVLGIRPYRCTHEDTAAGVAHTKSSQWTSHDGGRKAQEAPPLAEKLLAGDSCQGTVRESVFFSGWFPVGCPCFRGGLTYIWAAAIQWKKKKKWLWEEDGLERSTRGNVGVDLIEILGFMSKIQK